MIILDVHSLSDHLMLRVGFVYPENVRRAAWDNILLVLEKRGWQPLTEALKSWDENYATEKLWFIQQLAVCKLSGWYVPQEFILKACIDHFRTTGLHILYERESCARAIPSSSRQNSQLCGRRRYPKVSLASFSSCSRRMQQ